MSKVDLEMMTEGIGIRMKNIIRNSKKLLCMLLALAVCICILPATEAKAESTRLTFGDYNIKVWDGKPYAWVVGYNGTGADPVIPENIGGYTISGIYYGTFDCYTLGSETLHSITIPKTVTWIDHESFQGNDALTTVTFAPGSQLDEMGQYCFGGCSKLKNVTIPEGVTELHTTFNGCISLENIILPPKLTSMYAVFAGCRSLKSISIPASVQEMKGLTFKNCSGLTSVTFEPGSQLKTLGNEEFKGCINLKTITLPQGVTTMGTDVFKDCTSLETVCYPPALESAMAGSGAGYTAIKYTVNSDNTVNATVTGVPIGATAVTVPVEIDGKKVVKIESTVDSVQVSCSSHTLGTWASDADGHWITQCNLCGGSDTAKTAHRYVNGFCEACKYKEPAAVSKNNGENKTSGNNNFGNKNDKKKSASKKFTYKKAVYKVTNTKSKTVQYVKSSNKKAKNMTIPATVIYKGVKYKVTGIASNAFKNNKKIKKVSIGKNVKIIGSKAFYGCKKLKSITIKSTKLTGKNIGSQAFKGIRSKASIKVPAKKQKSYKKMLRKKGVPASVKFRKV